jgi:hypothetical protein
VTKGELKGPHALAAGDGRLVADADRPGHESLRSERMKDSQRMKDEG